MKTSEEMAVYIAKCEASIAMSKEKISAQERKQRDFDAALKKHINDAIAVTNKPLLDLINDIKASRCAEKPK